jgi:ribonuclease G
MSKEMIVSVNGREKKIAILENGKVTEFYIERGEENTGIAGNIYKGRVQRVLPGMQSAFVSIGLERDAFLYVSDFFDEEEEIERIVMDKSRKLSPEEAKREAIEKIERARLEREKQMESAQELAEPLAEIVDEHRGKKSVEKQDRQQRRERSGSKRKPSETIQEQQLSDDLKPEDVEPQPPEISEINIAEPPEIEFSDAGFERIIDDEETGELFKDAYVQEAIVDQVRAVEFDMEEAAAAEVGSLLPAIGTAEPVFERIADEDEEVTEQPQPKKRGRRTQKSKEVKESAIDADDPGEQKKKRTRKKESENEKPKRSSRSRKKAESSVSEAEPEPADNLKDESEVLSDGGFPDDAEASIRETPETAAMAVRRGGRGRRRGGRGKKKQASDSTDVSSDTSFAEEDKLHGQDSSDLISDTADGFIAEDESDSVALSENGHPTGQGLTKTQESGQDRNRDNRRDGGRKPDRRERQPQPTISDLLREGQEILVQIAKEPIARKGARITSHIALPGRFLVYMPTIEHVGVSRKIESSNERSRLRGLIQRIRAEEDVPSGGFIVRTAGIGISEEDLRQDARYLVRTWLDIKKASEKAKSPALVHQDLDLVQRLLRDQLSDDFTAIRVDSEEEYLRIVEFINRIQPKMVSRVKLYTREEPILEAFGVQEEIDKALKPRVWLKSGGYLVINQTEALVAIDVNTGKFVGKGNARLEDTIVKTNLEAVEEIARQIRLRDLGGIIVLDLIDMEDRRNRHKVLQALQEALSGDKSPTKVLSFNDFGLIIMTRKRVKQSLERTMCSPCEYCEGSGWVKSPTTVCYELLAEARRLSKHMEDIRQTTLRVHPEVARALRTSEKHVLEEVEAYLGPVDLTADPNIHQAQFDFAFI